MKQEIRNFEEIRDLAELRALSNYSLIQEDITETQTERMKYLIGKLYD